ncbi:hypothetical protein GCM10010407_02670 [Rarobacter incanus]
MALSLFAGAVAVGAPASQATRSGVSKVFTRSTLATAVLDSLAVKGRAPKTGYARTKFGPAWSDVDRNGCDTRNDILRRDLKGTIFRAGTHGCIVLTGTLRSKYTKERISYVRGPRSADVQIDHIVALSDAWQKGAQQISASARLSFANDPLNLLAVDDTSNMRKSDGDAATWLPKNKSYRCTYVARQISVKAKYNLWVTAAEKSAMKRVLSGCPGQRTYRSALSVAAAKVTSTKKRKKSKTKSSKSSAPVAPRAGGSCPSSAPIKGNRNSMIYHVPGGRYYKVTKAEQCFATAAGAQKAGYRASRAG